MSFWSSYFFVINILFKIRNYCWNLINKKWKIFFLLCTYSFLESPYSFIEGVNAWIICLPSGAKDESSKVGMRWRLLSLSNSSQFSTIIWWQLSYSLLDFSTPKWIETKRRRLIGLWPPIFTFGTFLLAIKPFFLSFSPNVSHLVELDTMIFDKFPHHESLTPTAFSSLKIISVTLALYRILLLIFDAGNQLLCYLSYAAFWIIYTTCMSICKNHSRINHRSLIAGITDQQSIRYR